MLSLPIDTIMRFDGNRVSDQGRSELGVTSEVFKNEQRMVDGTLRRYVVAEKRTWSCSWTNIFSKRSVDGAWAGEEIKSFYYDTPGEFLLTLTMGDGTTEDILAMFTSFDYDVAKRSAGENGDLWNMSMEITEV